MTLLDQAQLKERLGQGKQIVVDFYADWCGPCRAIAPELDKLAAEYTDVEFVKVDADGNPDLLRELGVMGLPTLVRFSESGDEVARAVGSGPARALAFRLGLGNS